MSIDVGLERLRRLAAGCEDPETIARCAVAEMVPHEPSDDVVLLAARLPLLPDRLQGRWPADAHALADARQLLRRWLRAQGASDLEVDDITIAAQEACTNAVEHAYGPGRATFELEASCEAGRVRIAVRDGGRWREPRGTNRGRGLPIMEALMEVVDVRQTAAGTEVVLERTLGAA